MRGLHIHNLHVRAQDAEILHGLTLSMAPGELHVLMGPNGSGKSTLAQTLAGHPKYQVTQGQIILNGQDITDAPANVRAKIGLFLSPQYPPEIEGVTIANFLRLAVQARTEEQLNPLDFYKTLKASMKKLGMDESFVGRHVHAGFSGGEKKKCELLQLQLLNPRVALLDETDSGLDVDALQIVAKGVAQFAAPDKTMLLITHYTRILQFLSPTHVHVMRDGNIVKSGDAHLAQIIEKKGYGIV